MVVKKFKVQVMTMTEREMRKKVKEKDAAGTRGWCEKEGPHYCSFLKPQHYRSTSWTGTFHNLFSLHEED